MKVIIEGRCYGDNRMLSSARVVSTCYRSGVSDARKFMSDIVNLIDQYKLALAERYGNFSWKVRTKRNGLLDEVIIVLKLGTTIEVIRVYMAQ